MIFLKDEDFIAKGNERACYYHPNDKTKTIKITFENNNRKDSKQSEKEIKYYKQLKNKGLNNWQHLPKYFGEVQTNKGNGFIIELIKDYDGKISKSFAYYLKKYDLKKYEKQVEIYKQYFHETQEKIEINILLFFNFIRNTRFHGQIACYGQGKDIHFLIEGLKRTLQNLKDMLFL